MAVVIVVVSGLAAELAVAVAFGVDIDSLESFVMVDSGNMVVVVLTLLIALDYYSSSVAMD